MSKTFILFYLKFIVIIIIISDNNNHHHPGFVHLSQVTSDQQTYQAPLTLKTEQSRQTEMWLLQSAVCCC